MLVGQGAVAEEDVGPEPQHTSRQILVGDVEYLRVVVGVREGDAATRPDDPDELPDRGVGIGEVLQGAVGPGAVEGVVEERQPVGVGDGALRQAARLHGGSHGDCAVHGHHAGVVFVSEADRTRPGARTDLDVAPAGHRMGQFADSMLIRLVEGLVGEAIEHADPRVRV